MWLSLTGYNSPWTKYKTITKIVIYKLSFTGITMTGMTDMVHLHHLKMTEGTMIDIITIETVVHHDQIHQGLDQDLMDHHHQDQEEDCCQPLPLGPHLAPLNSSTLLDLHLQTMALQDHHHHIWALHHFSKDHTSHLQVILVLCLLHLCRPCRLQEER